jgi:uncharacterized protein YpmB
MKKLSLVLAVLIAALLLCSCSGSKESSSAASKAENTKTLSQVFEDIKSKVEIKDFNEFTSAKSLERYYGLTEKNFDDFAGGINSTGTNQEEIVLIKVKDQAGVAEVQTALQNRYDNKMAQNKNYNPKQAEMVSKCKVETFDLYVTLIVSPNAEKITEIFKSDLGL